VGDGAGGGVFLFPVKLHNLQAKSSRPINASVEIDFITEIDYVNELLWLIAFLVFHPGRETRKFPVFHFPAEFLFHRAFHGQLVEEHDQRDDQKEKNNPENHTALLMVGFENVGTTDADKGATACCPELLASCLSRTVGPRAASVSQRDICRPGQS
jgi:hypothetical protein